MLESENNRERDRGSSVSQTTAMLAQKHKACLRANVFFPSHFAQFALL